MPCRYESCPYSDKAQPCPHHAQGKTAIEYEVMNTEIEKLIRQLGEKLGESIPPGYGFALWISNDPKLSDDPPNTFWISSFERPAIVSTISSLFTKWGYTVRDKKGKIIK